MPPPARIDLTLSSGYIYRIAWRLLADSADYFPP